MLSTFLLQLGAGCLFGVIPVPARSTGRAFNRFVAALASAILILGIAAGWGTQRPISRPLWILAAVASMAAGAAAHLGRVEGSRLPVLLAAACCMPALGLDALALARSSGHGSGLDTLRYVLDAPSAAWALGSVLISMVLGHYYLNIPGLSTGHLVRLCLIAMAAVGLRAILSGLGLALDGAAIVSPWIDGDLGSGDMLSLVVLLQRLLFGLAGAFLLTTMAWRTARIDSTQSATGILYIGFIAVLVGELASRYLLFGTGHPI
jgi:hypothetical protein